MNRMIEKAQCLYERNQEVVLATILETSGSAPRKTGTQMMIFNDGSTCGTIGGGDYEKSVIEGAQKIFKTRQDTKLIYSMTNDDASFMDMICGGEVTTLLQYFTGNDLPKLMGSIKQHSEGRLFIFGAGHVGVAISQLAKFLGIPTTVLDDRIEFCNKERFPSSYCRVLESFDVLPDIVCEESDMFVIVTRGHSADRQCLQLALKTKASYIGMIGSERKRELIYDSLIKNNGFSSEQLARVRSPIGLDIGAEKPEEIALSIMAEIVKFRAEK